MVKEVTYEKGWFVTMEFKASTKIDAPPEKVWSVLTNAAAYPEWDPNMNRLEGNIALGEKVTAHTKLSDRAFPVKVAVFEPNRRMVWSGGMPLGLFKADRSFVLEPDGDGTQFHLKEQFGGPLLFLFKGTVPDLQPSFEQFAAGLKARAEQ